MTINIRLVLKVAAIIAIIGVGYIIRSHSGAGNHIGWTIAGWSLSAYVVIRIALALRRGRAALKAQGDERVSIKTIEKAAMSAMPAWMQGWSSSEMKIYGGFWRSLHVPLVQDQRFTVSKGRRGELIYAFAVLALASLAVAGLVLLAGWSTSQKSLWIGIACIAGPALYLLVMLAGERRLLKEAGHVVMDDRLVLALGIRFTGEVALADVLACAPLAGSNDDAWVVSPFEKPNVLLTLRKGIVVEAERFGYPFKPGQARLALYVDEPARFVDAVSAAIARQLPRYA